mmetsp:Transcript_15512/g.38095  ORF Transcript_15512/g.38095 Transcript_15512/m.38095 type:complete len:290 (+) Transcript_15512:3252-4121(+)
MAVLTGGIPRRRAARTAPGRRRLRCAAGGGAAHDATQVPLSTVARAHPVGVVCEAVPGGGSGAVRPRAPGAGSHPGGRGPVRGGVCAAQVHHVHQPPAHRPGALPRGGGGAAGLRAPRRRKGAERGERALLIHRHPLFALAAPRRQRELRAPPRPRGGARAHLRPHVAAGEGSGSSGGGGDGFGSSRRPRQPRGGAALDLQPHGQRVAAVPGASARVPRGDGAPHPLHYVLPPRQRQGAAYASSVRAPHDQPLPRLCRRRTPRGAPRANVAVRGASHHTNQHRSVSPRE